jgi:hypothetical protein
VIYKKHIISIHLCEGDIVCLAQGGKSPKIMESVCPNHAKDYGNSAGVCGNSAGVGEIPIVNE